MTLLYRSRQSWLIPIIIAIAFAVPLLIPAVAPLIDLPTHMARYRVGEAIAHSPELSHYFTFEWRFMPNLGVDIIAIGASHLIGLETAVRIVIASIPAIAILGIAGIANEAHGRITLPAMLAMPLALAYPMTFGFVNYCFSIALSLAAFGLWLNMSKSEMSTGRSFVFALIAPVILLCHIVGYGVLGILCGGSIIGRAIDNKESFPRTVLLVLKACLPLAWPIVLLFIWRTENAPSPSGWLDWHVRVTWIVGVLRDRWAVIDILSAVVIYTGCLLPLLFPKHFSYNKSVGVPALLLWTVALALPSTFITQFASVRLYYVATVLNLIAVSPKFDVKLKYWLLGASFLALRVFSHVVSMVDGDRIFKREMEALDHVQQGSFVYAINMFDCTRHWAPPRLIGLPSMATVRRDAYVNNQFITTEGQLLGLNPGQPGLSGFLQSTTVLRPCERWSIVRTLDEQLARAPWQQMDYLWVISMPKAYWPKRSSLRLIWNEGNSALFKNMR